MLELETVSAPIVQNSAVRVARDDAAGERQISFVENPCGVLSKPGGAPPAPVIVMPEIVAGELPVTKNTGEPNSPVDGEKARPRTGDRYRLHSQQFTTSSPGFPPVSPRPLR